MPGGRETNKVNEEQRQADAERSSSGSRDLETSDLQPETDPGRLGRATADPLSSAPADILGLQRTLGNRATTRLIDGARRGSTDAGGPLQTKMSQEEFQTALKEYLTGPPLSISQDDLREEVSEFKSWFSLRYDGGVSGYVNDPKRAALGKRGLLSIFAAWSEVRGAYRSRMMTAQAEAIKRRRFAARGLTDRKAIGMFNPWFNTMMGQSFKETIERNYELTEEDLNEILDEYIDWANKLKDPYYEKNLVSDVPVPMGTRVMVRQSELDAAGLTGLYTVGADPCVTIGIQLQMVDQDKGHQDILALSHFDGTTEPSIVRTMYDEVVKAAQGNDGEYTITITLAGGTNNPGPHGKESLPGPELFHQMATIAKDIQRRDKGVVLVERQSLDNEAISVRIDQGSGMNLFKGVSYNAESAEDLVLHPEALKATQLALARGALLNERNDMGGDPSPDGIKIQTAMARAVRAAEKPDEELLMAVEERKKAAEQKRKAAEQKRKAAKKTANKGSKAKDEAKDKRQRPPPPKAKSRRWTPEDDDAKTNG